MYLATKSIFYKPLLPQSGYMPLEDTYLNMFHCVMFFHAICVFISNVFATWLIKMFPNRVFL